MKSSETFLSRIIWLSFDSTVPTRRPICKGMSSPRTNQLPRDIRKKKTKRAANQFGDVLDFDGTERLDETQQIALQHRIVQGVQVVLQT